jgi:hypothetical protein
LKKERKKENQKKLSFESKNIVEKKSFLEERKERSQKNSPNGLVKICCKVDFVNL